MGRNQWNSKKEKINKAKYWFNEKINKLLERLIKKKGEKTQTHKIPMSGIRRGEITTDPMNIKR